MMGQFLGCIYCELDWLVVARYITMRIVCFQLKELQHPCKKSVLIGSRSLFGQPVLTIIRSLCIVFGFLLFWRMILRNQSSWLHLLNEPYIFITLLCPNYFPPLNAIYLYCKDWSGLKYKTCWDLPLLIYVFICTCFDWYIQDSKHDEIVSLKHYNLFPSLSISI